VAIAVAAAVLAWVPTVAVHWIRGGESPALDVAIVTLAMFGVAAGECFYVSRRDHTPAPYLLTVLFVWLLAPLAFFLGASATGGGMAQLRSLQDLATFVLLYPGLMFLGPFYDGSVLGLAVLSVTLVVAAFTSAARTRTRGVG